MFAVTNKDLPRFNDAERTNSYFDHCISVFDYCNYGLWTKISENIGVMCILFLYIGGKIL